MSLHAAIKKALWVIVQVSFGFVLFVPVFGRWLLLKEPFWTLEPHPGSPDWIDARLNAFGATFIILAFLACQILAWWMFRWLRRRTAKLRTEATGPYSKNATD